MSRRLLCVLAIFSAIVVSTSRPLWADGCSAMKTCPGGEVRNCNGQSICEVLSNGVRCDGVFYGCPSGPPSGCRIDYVCPAPPFTEAWYVACDGQFSCEIDAVNNWVICDGILVNSCQECEDAYQRGALIICPIGDR
jgi:hypothetical protein